MEVIATQGFHAEVRRWRFRLRPCGAGFMQVSLNMSWAANLQLRTAHTPF